MSANALEVAAIIIALATILAPYAYLVTMLSNDVFPLVRRVIQYGEWLLNETTAQTTSGIMQGFDIEKEINVTAEKYLQTLDTIVANSTNTLKTLCNATNSTTCREVVNTLQSIYS